MKDFLVNRAINGSSDYRERVTSYVNTYTFGTTAIHDQGPLVNQLVWENPDPAHLAASFNSISNFKRILFMSQKEELEFFLTNSRLLIDQIDQHLND